MTAPNKTEIAIVVDRSGSMESIAREMELAIDALIKKQLEAPGECLITLVEFDHEYLVKYQSRPASQVPPTTIEPRGSTALLDAIGATVRDLGARLDAQPEEQRAAKVVVVVVTDGLENASRFYDRNSVADSIKHQREKYSWEFIFLGTTEAAIAAAQTIGIMNSVQYDCSFAGTQAIGASLGNAIKSSRERGVAVNYNQTIYNSTRKP